MDPVKPFKQFNDHVLACMRDDVCPICGADLEESLTFGSGGGCDCGCVNSVATCRCGCSLIGDRDGREYVLIGPVEIKVVQDFLFGATRRRTPILDAVARVLATRSNRKRCAIKELQRTLG